MRVRDAWGELHKQAREAGRPFTPLCPGWLRLVDGKWEKISEAVAVVRRVVRMVMDGYSLNAITRQLDSENIKTLKRGTAWDAAGLRALVRSPALIGNLQPKSYGDGRRQVSGDPIVGYYGTGILTKKEFYRLQETLDSRRTVRGRNGTGVRSLFRGLLYDLAGHSLVITAKGARTTLVGLVGGTTRT